MVTEAPRIAVMLDDPSDPFDIMATVHALQHQVACRGMTPGEITFEHINGNEWAVCRVYQPCPS